MSRNCSLLRLKDGEEKPCTFMVDITKLEKELLTCDINLQNHYVIALYILCGLLVYTYSCVINLNARYYFTVVFSISQRDASRVLTFYT